MRSDRIEFVDSVLSPERNIFLENDFEKGEYLILVEPYWQNNLVDTFNVGTYSENDVEIELLPCNDNLYEKTEYRIWKSFA